MLSTLFLHGIVAGAVLAQEPEVAAGVPPDDFGRSFSLATPEQVGLDSGKLLVLTEWLQQNPFPIFSLLISRHGKLVYELYTSGLDREHAHYVMSVTKSFVSALIGIAIDKKLLAAVDKPITDTLPRRLFASDAEFARFANLTLDQVLGMAALDAPIAPHDPSPTGQRRLLEFSTAPDRLRFALTQALLPKKPAAFQYNDITPMLAIGALQYGTGKSAFDFAQEQLFLPLGFRNAEWMHQDAAGFDNGGYGLCLRPIDMQKFGVLFLARGAWAGKQLLSKSWVDRSFTPWNRSQPEYAEPNYGSFWWTRRDAKWPRHEANGWKGQRIAVIPTPGLVVTMTACFEDGGDDAMFCKLLDDYLAPAVRNSNGAKLPAADVAHTKLLQALREARTWQRLAASLEPRMVPTVANKESHRAFVDAAPPTGRGH